jgi:hypothetical protein
MARGHRGQLQGEKKGHGGRQARAVEKLSGVPEVSCGARQRPLIHSFIHSVCGQNSKLREWDTEGDDPLVSLTNICCVCCSYPWSALHVQYSIYSAI